MTSTARNDLLDTVEQLFTDTFPEIRRALAAAETTDGKARRLAARRRRSDTRAAADQASHALALEQMQQWAADAHDASTRYEQEALALGHDEANELCRHCTLLSSAATSRAAAQGWDARTENPDQRHDYTPRERYVRHYDARTGWVWVMVEDDERMPEFAPIEHDALRPDHRARLDRLVSDARNWAQWDQALQIVPAVHVKSPSGRVGMKVGKPRFKRDYPGFHLITERDEHGRPMPDPFRTAVITTWLDHRSQWAVYVATDGGRKGRFTQWIAHEWYLVPDMAERRRLEYGPGNLDQPCLAHEMPYGTCDHCHATPSSQSPSDNQHLSMERALEVAYLKAAQLRVDLGQDAPYTEALPFSPDVLGEIADAQANGLERRRTTSEPGE